MPAASHTSGHSEGTPSHNSDDESDYHEHELRNSASSRGKAAANSKKKPAASRRSSQHTLEDHHLHNEDSAESVVSENRRRAFVPNSLGWAVTCHAHAGINTVASLNYSASASIRAPSSSL
ncbi:hypothetical protein P389DRAFT_67813 [Cystobasidium minutum MCA 4210]|uniref:uncharacterized protein n=1 Tax=Cystobasidium minutum MCA 4210 TaxID=1397322 RepID=UPI0034CD9522|eukprot:jgi/Rhomi1/67813/CE67812_547